jgi:transcriptional regulator with XRE-family HTH domain
MTFGARIRELRKTKNMSQRDLAAKVRIDFTYLSKIENERLDFGEAPGEETIKKLAHALDIDVDELLLLAQRIPESIRTRVLSRPAAFRKIASLNDDELNRILRELEEQEK